MLDSSNSSLFDATREWKEKADDALQASLARLLANTEKESRNISQAHSISRLLAQTKRGPSQSEVNKQIELEEKHQKQWTRTQIQEINFQAEKEMANLTQLKAQQQAVFQNQINEKNDIWDKVLIARRAEAAKLRMMISKLSNEIAKARNEAKSAIDLAKKQENENLRVIRQNREKLIRQITDLTNEIQKEKIMFESENRVNKNTMDMTLTQKQETVQRLQKRLDNLKKSHDDKEADQKTQFKEEMKRITELRALLDAKNEEKVQKQSEIMEMKKQCASMSRMICSRKDEASSYARQITAMRKDNERVEEQIAKMEQPISVYGMSYSKSPKFSK